MIEEQSIPFLLLVLVSLSLTSAVPKVSIEQGLLSGKELFTREGRKVVGFLGIPYAAPPTGQLRFKSPQAPASWQGERDATKDGSSCIQQFTIIEKLRTSVIGQEDCLFLNVFTPKLLKSAKLPVMFFIHGGGYAGGSGASADYGPELLLDQDVVLVTVNYRLGPLGFLSTGDKVLPGNLGLKDQQAALRWVQKNIDHFGGDKNSVTIFGESAGGASVNMHMLSSTSKGLFHAAISQSGVALTGCAFSSAERHRNMAAKLAELVNCPAQPSKDLLDCLMRLPAEQIVGTQHHFLEWDLEPVVLFSPTAEPKDVEDAFLTEDPWNLTSDIPWMVGFNENEGALKAASLTQGDVSGKFKQLNENFDYIMPMFLFYQYSAQNPSEITKKVRRFYFDDAKEITLDHISQMIKLHTDAYFMAPALEAARRHDGPVFVYYFAYNMSTSFSLCSHYFDNPKFFGVCHFDELLYLFPMEGFYPKPEHNNADYLMSKNMVQLWTNFAKNRVPSMDGKELWKRRKGFSKKYLKISKDGFKIKKKLLSKRFQFWRDLPYRTKPDPINKKNKAKDEL